MPKIAPPELKRFMDKKLSSEWGGSHHGQLASGRSEQ